MPASTIARVIGALRTRGLWGPDKSRWCRCPARRAVATERADSKDATRTEAAVTIWQAALPGGGTVVAAYLMSRGLHLVPPSRLRFHPGLKHPSGGVWPAMVGLVTRAIDNEPLAIHRTFLARGDAGKAPVNTSKMMLGPKLPRMADFALWATVCETALSPAGMIWTAYGGNRDEAVEGVVDADRQGSSRRL